MQTSARWRVLKILLFLLVGMVTYFFLPQMFWKLTPDLWFVKGPAKGACVAAVLLFLLTFLALRSDGLDPADAGIAFDH